MILRWNKGGGNMGYEAPKAEIIDFEDESIFAIDFSNAEEE